MDYTADNLYKLATELTDRVEELEHENEELRLRANQAELSKSAAELGKPASPVVSRETADKTIECLVKCGALDKSQADASRDVLMSDAEAPHRILQKVLDGQMKTASDDSDVSGGTVVGASAGKQSGYEDDCLDRVMRILGR